MITMNITRPPHLKLDGVAELRVTCYELPGGYFLDTTFSLFGGQRAIHPKRLLLAGNTVTYKKPVTLQYKNLTISTDNANSDWANLYLEVDRFGGIVNRMNQQWYGGPALRKFLQENFEYWAYLECWDVYVKETSMRSK